MKKILITVFLNLAVVFLLSIFIYPEPNKEYSGFWVGLFSGSLHGSLLIPNWIISQFDGTRLIKATTYSGWYNFCWWCGVIMNFYSLLISPIISNVKEKN